ncbi:MAG: hypothetical protein JW818_22000 [Pirellulales bacterium]|nr:hypothetical protein [Pirellulales bacterium]
MISGMNGWDVALLAGAGYIAVMALARLMIGHRDALLARFRSQFKAEQERKAKEKKKAEAEERMRRQRAA